MSGELAKLHLLLPITPHCLHYCLNHPPLSLVLPPEQSPHPWSVENLSSTKLVPGAKNVGGCWPMSQLPQASMVQHWEKSLQSIISSKRQRWRAKWMSNFFRPLRYYPRVPPLSCLTQNMEGIRTKKRGGDFQQPVGMDLNCQPAAPGRLSCNGSWHLALLESLARLNGGECSLPKPVCKDWRMWLLLQMCRHKCKATKIMKNQENMTPQARTKRKIKQNKWTKKQKTK